MRPARSDRRGGVFIALATITLGTLLLATLMRLDWSSRALSEAGDGAGGAVAESLALSAVAEAQWRFQTEGNQPGDPLFAKVREKLRTSSGPIDLSKDLKPEKLARMLKTGEAAGSFGVPTIESFEAVLRPGNAPESLVVRCTVRVDHGMGSFARRTARESRRWGLNGVFAPQPLDQPTAAILHAGVLAQHVPALGRWQDAIRQFNRCVRDFGALVEQVNALPPQPGKQTVTMMPTYFGCADDAALDAEESAVVALQRAAQPWKTKERILEMARHGSQMGEEAPTGRRYNDTVRDDVYFAGATPLRFDVERSLRLRLQAHAGEKLTSKTLVEAEHAANALLSFAEQVNLERWDPNARFAQTLARTLDALGRIGTRVGKLEARTAASEKARREMPDGGVQNFVSEMNQLLVQMANAIGNGTGSFNEFTRAMLSETRAPLVAPEESGRAHPSVAAHTSVGDLPEWIKKFHGANGTLTVRFTREEVEKWKKEHKGEPLPAVALDVGDWEGKSLIDLNNLKTDLKALQVDDAARDRVVLRSGPLTFAGGRVDAGVYADSVTTKGAADINGALVIGSHAERDEDGPKRLKGTVTHDARFLAGVFVDGADDRFKPDWKRVCDSAYVLILDPRGWGRDVRQSRGKR